VQDISTLTADSILEKDVFDKLFTVNNKFALEKQKQKLEKRADELKVRKNFDRLLDAYAEEYVKNKKQTAIELKSQNPVPSQPGRVMLKRDEETGKIIQSIENIREVLRNDKNLAGKIRYNVFSICSWQATLEQ